MVSSKVKIGAAAGAGGKVTRRQGGNMRAAEVETENPVEIETNKEIVPIEHSELALAREPAIVLSEAKRAAEALRDVISKKANPVIMNGEQYLEFEDWQLVAQFYGCSVKIVSTAPVSIGEYIGFEAKAVVYNMRTNEEVGSAEAMCLNDEEKWSGRPRYEWRYVLKDGSTQADDPGPNNIIWIDNPGKPGKKMPKKERVLAGEEKVPLFQLRSMSQCVPERAEILTRQGFRRWDQIQVGDEVLAYDCQNDISRWTPLKAINVYDNEPVWHLRSRSFQVTCTPDHTWAVQNPRAQKFDMGGDRRSTTFMAEQGRRRASKRIGLIKTKDFHRANKLIVAAPAETGESPLSPQDAAILGWLITDGSLRKTPSGKHRGHIDQANEKFIPEIRALLGAHASESVTIPDPNHLTPHGHPWGKKPCYRFSLKSTFVNDLMARASIHSRSEMPALVTRLSSDARKAMLEAMLNADGSEIRKSGIYRFAKNNPQTIETFQILCALEGIALGRPHRRNDIAHCYATRRHRYAHLKWLKISNGEPEKVWCPTTQYGTWIMRLDGFVTITGNTRAAAKALRNRFAWVVVLAGYKPTPAEELTETQVDKPKAKSESFSWEGKKNLADHPDYDAALKADMEAQDQRKQPQPQEKATLTKAHLELKKEIDEFIKSKIEPDINVEDIPDLLQQLTAYASYQKEIGKNPDGTVQFRTVPPFRGVRTFDDPNFSEKLAQVALGKFRAKVEEIKERKGIATKKGKRK